jgi:hypothetical protein
MGLHHFQRTDLVVLDRAGDGPYSGEGKLG